jgi:hypothetical protein
MVQKTIFRILVFIGIANASTIIISALTGSNAYTIANSIQPYYYIILCYIPLVLVLISIVWYIIDLRIKPTVKINYFLLAFCGISADAVFVIGSHFFAQGH